MRPPLRLHPRDTSPAPNVDLAAEADLTRCGALKDFWYVACLSTELKPGQPLARTLFGTGVVLFRDAHGQPTALRDRCLHRNARLSRGAVFDGRIGCPYHGWVYDASGAVVEVPSLGPSQRSELLDANACAREGLATEPCALGRLTRFPTVEQDGLVFVYMGGAEPARAAPFRVPCWGQAGWTVYFMVTRFPNGVTNLVENFMDVPHTLFVHPGWFRRPASKRVPATVRRTAGSVLVTYKQAQDTVTGLGRLFNPRGLPLLHTDKFYVPNVTRVDYLWGEHGFVINSQCTPIGPTDSLVYTAISYRLPVDVPGALVGRAMMPLVRWYTRQVIRQDVAIMDIQREALLDGPGGGVYSGTEADLHHADIEAYRRWLREGGQGPGPEDTERDMAFWI
ncbi:aromatic ring-hydroxylating dioxygenase subunit alpha [Myxococcus sp. AM009]|uniref:aromatic ring-hydroxylating dioxygenase subunit alpha n=1 Tax=unclassified Myxococcus TaxID=2648731 RepID=UPI001595695E|nr:MULTISPECIES: aromatic ring-hydroxylating dioxygenase subunit alpha [unclassified Myxococcus]NVI97390.1 aromatic ring-hydroxylating dioxygenase subunit alpha [Myxococcus sp. AM009]NVJ16903.1 aromatic ring-hydroxylating dioxygenase subunit alpha [Myxococcus sp. AM010]